MFNIFTYIIFLPPAIAFIAYMTMDCKLNVLLYGFVSIANITANDLLKNMLNIKHSLLAITSLAPT